MCGSEEGQEGRIHGTMDVDPCSELILITSLERPPLTGTKQH